ncbi:hypothetical protein CY35_15G104700 [Sphagnum magellanicum]|nr:hypothetical protein CY35_15G104700 [Sphagnum magellanicum]
MTTGGNMRHNRLEVVLFQGLPPHILWCKLWGLKGAFRWSSFVASFTCKTRFQETDSEWLSHVLHQALQVFPLKGDSTCSLCKSL